VTVKLRLASFKTITRSRTLGEPTDVAREIYTAAWALYEASGLDGRARLRLVGVRATGLRPATGAARQLAFGERQVGWREAEQAVDRIARRFGTDAVRPAALFGTSQEHARPASQESQPEAPSNLRDLPRNLGNEPGV
jgi:DNA polymerase-4